MRLLKRSGTKAPASSDGERVLGIEESLQSIAVELHRGNKIASQQLVLQQRQVDLVNNYLDIVRAGQLSTGNADALKVVEGLLAPITDLIGGDRRLPRVASPPEDPPAVTHEGAGMRVAQTPEV